MKKPNLSKQGIKDFFFRHVEKLFFGLACGLILLFVWLGFKTPSFDTITPKAMLTKTEQAERFITDDSHWNKLKEHRIADTTAATRIGEAKPVDPNTYLFHQICGTVVFTLEPRRDPALVPVKDFEVQYFRAQIAQAKTASQSSGLALAGSGINGLPDSDLEHPQDQINESFIYRASELDADKVILRTFDAVVGMAIIDHKQQVTNYKENFQYQRGYDAARDIPEYTVIEVQRKTDDTEWESITARVYTNAAYLATPAKELADEEFIIPTIALPIPPMLGIDYRQFSMVSKIKTRDVFADDEERGGKKDREDREENSSGSSDDPFGEGNSAGSDDSSDDKPEMEKKDGAAEDEGVPVRLVRFYDLAKKETGKTYYYRVRAWVKDPNNPLAVNANIAGKLKDSSGRGGIGLGSGTSGGGSQADAPSGGGRNKNNRNAQKALKPLSEFDLSGEVRERVNGEKEIPKDVVGKEWTNTDAGLATKLKTLQETLQEAYRFSRPTEWVEAAKPVTITSGFETFVGGPVNAPPSIRIGTGVFSITEPTVNVVANSFQDDLKTFVPALEPRAMRGSLLNFEAVTNLLNPLTWKIKEVFDSEDSKGNKRGRRFKTDAVVLDIMGGNRLGRGGDSFAAPGEFIVMDRNGRIHIHNDIEDATAYRHANFVSSDNEETREAASGRKKDDDDEGGDDVGGGGGRGR